MITCERCNTENIDGSQYCDECGALLIPVSRGRKSDTTFAEDGNNGLHRDALGRAANSSPDMAPAFSPDRAESNASPPSSASTASSNASASSASARLSPDSMRAGGPHAKLVINRGRSVGKEFPINTDEAHIGRWDADGGIFPDVDLDADDLEAKVSRRHARITRRSGQYFIEDMGSTNGTFINRGRRLLPGDRQALHDGDEVIVGKTIQRFQVIKQV